MGKVWKGEKNGKYVQISFKLDSSVNESLHQSRTIGTHCGSARRWLSAAVGWTLHPLGDQIGNAHL